MCVCVHQVYTHCLHCTVLYTASVCVCVCVCVLSDWTLSAAAYPSKKLAMSVSWGGGGVHVHNCA